ncbi:FCD domain-containing protein [Nocardia sp. R7R-8]|uniref:FCD domain-containing protein n=1 Tax=Nocardia sp. R7R-8 TaxID=3459304 RepID=UPI00403E135D
MAARDQQTVGQVYEMLKRDIIRGVYTPGQPLSQLQIANTMGISRTPLREAFRLLEQHGLVVPEHNKRFRVAEFGVADLEELYAMRIILEGYAARVSVPRLSAADLEELVQLSRQMSEAEDLKDYDKWSPPHHAFHQLLLAQAGPRALTQIGHLSEHSERYRYVSTLPQLPLSWEQGRSDHDALLEAALARDGNAAAIAIARHYGRVALSVISLAAPEHDPIKLRIAMGASTLAAPL